MKLVSVLFIFLCFATSSFSQTNNTTPNQKEKAIYHRAKIFYGSAQGLLALANQGVAVDHGKAKAGVWIESDFSEQELNVARMMGMQVEISIEDVSQYYKDRNAKDKKEMESLDFLNKNSNCSGSTAPTYTQPTNWELGSMGGFYTYYEMLAELDAMATAYPNLITVRAPISTFQTINGESIYWVKISDNPNVDENEPEMLYDAIHHAREPMSMQQLIYYMWYLLENHATNSEVQAIVDNSELYFIPVLNVDGFKHNCNQDSINGGGMWRKNRRNHGNGDYGVDNNRNYDFHDGSNTSMWGTTGVNFNTSNDTYPGSGPFSEVENQAMKWFCENHDFKLALNNHSYDNSLLYPYGYANNQLTPDNNTYIAIADAMVKHNGYGMQAKLSSLLYPASGDSDDWMYGDDLANKPKIFAFTPEIGNNGFWPPMNEIAPTCNSMVYTNLMAAHLITNYAETKDVMASSITSTSGFFKYEIQRLGIEAPANFTVSINPLTSNILTIGSANTHNNMSMLQTDLDSISYTLNTSILDGDAISYEILINNGYYSETIVINKTYGIGTPVLVDNGTNVANWTTTGNWGTTTSDYYSAPSSITDSPNGNYSNNTNRTIALSNNVNLTTAIGATLSFYARWDIEVDYDYVQVEVSTNNGATWDPQCGKYTNTGNANQDQNAPLYDGLQNSWVYEEIDLSQYLGSNIKVRFQLVSDQGVTEDGFYFDDLEISVLETPVGIDNPNANFNLSSYPNPANELVTISYSTPNDLNNAFLIITNELGQEVKSLKITKSKGSITIATDELQSGIYFYSIASTNIHSVTKKLMVVK